jgi:hypothetical protein
VADRGEKEVKPLPISVALAVLLTAGLPGQDLPPWVLLLARVKQHGRASFEHIPDYTCQKTVSRSVKPPDSQSFTPIDTAAFTSESLIVSGAISATPLNLFVHDAGRITVSSEADLHDGTTLRFDFEVSALAGAYRVRSGESQTMVGVRGTFWVDPQSLDLLRIEEHAVDLPPDLNTRDVVTTITYGRTRIGSSDVLLPRSSELVVTDSSGGQQRSLVEFSGCRAPAEAGLPGQDLPPWVLLLARVKQHGRASFEHIPDYTCLETVNRFERPRNGASFRQIGTLLLEVASVGGKELFARKGAARFQDGDPAAFTSEGLIGSGDFSATPLNLFVHDAGRITAAPEAGLFTGMTLRFDFEVSALAGAYQVRSGGIKTMVGVRGTFWVDPQSLDLLRIEEHHVGLPPDLNIRDIVTTIIYGRTRIGPSEPLLPQSSEVIVTNLSGGQKRNLIEFSGCREYGSESTIHFAPAGPEPPPAPKKK